MTEAGIPGTFGNAFPGAKTKGIEAEGADSSSVTLGWDGSVRARLGVLASPNFLIFATGGVSFQRVEVGAACDGTAASWCSFGFPKSQTSSMVKTGWTAGGGVEGPLAGEWMGRFEVRYADYGHVNTTFFAGTGDDVTTSVSLRTLTLLAGVGHKFGPAGPTSASH